MTIHIRSHTNEEYRSEQVTRLIQEIALSTKSPRTLLDVGAGLSPYRDIALQFDWIYLSHDFGKYLPHLEKTIGLQSETWQYPIHDFECDILDIPGEELADFVICTEVFEHLPDPVRALDKLSKLCKPGGMILVTVPLSSLMHQAPYWFQTGLSSFWFEYWAEKYSLNILELITYGDYVDVSRQEFMRMTKLSRIEYPSFQRFIDFPFRFLRKCLNDDLVQSSGFGVIFLAQVPLKESEQ